MTQDHHDWQLDSIVGQLREARSEWRSAQARTHEPGDRELPSRTAMNQVIDSLAGALFPMRLGPADLRKANEDFYVGHTLDQALNILLQQAVLELRHTHRHAPLDTEDLQQQARGIVGRFASELPTLRRILDSDVMAAYHGDPAARSVDEVLLCYPGVMAIVHHRIAHLLYREGLTLLARLVSELAHSDTGIDIHPGAQIGSSFFIDHGTGVVIGETAIIGERVRIYQAVTLGAKRFESDDQGKLLKGQARHPIVEDDVVIYAGATILGRITIGAGSTIGGNVWVTRSLPPGSNVSQASLKNQLGV
jgi:serine O-acetyltransferase